MKRFLLLAATAAALVAQSIPGSYLVELDGEPTATLAKARRVTLAQPNDEVTARRSQIARQHTVADNAVRAMGGRVTRTFDTLINAVAVEIDDAAAASLASMPGVKAVYQNHERHGLLDRAIMVHKISEAWQRVGGSSSAGAGMKIAIIDSGIDNTHPAFLGFGVSIPKGFPITSSEREKKNINSKIIVSRDYTGKGGRDTYGHGTGTAMIAAGLTVDPGVLNLAPITGVAPGAWLGNYRVLDDTGSTDMITELTAIQDAVNDGMNVINLSLGSVQLDLSAESGAEARAINNAVAAGVLVIAASGNSGPESGTIADPATSPLAISVGSNENDRYFDYAVLLGDLPPYPAQVPTAQADTVSGRVTGNLVDAAKTTNPLGCNAFATGSLADKVVLISRGTCQFDVKVNNAAKGGAAGVIIFNTNANELIDMSLPTAKLPSTFVALESGLEMQSQLRAHPDITASIDFTGFTPIPASADELSFFSARGPTATGVIKPEITAVGNNIFTASTAIDSSYLPFTLAGGTSFSAPIVTGAAAVLMSARPGLQASDYRSLLINSTQPIRTSNGATVDVLEGGAGRLDLSRAIQNNLSVSPVTLSGILNATDDATIKTISITNAGTFTDTFVLNVVNGDTNAPYVDAGPFTLEPGQSQTVIVRVSQMAKGATRGFIVATGSKGNVSTRIPYWFGVPGADVKQVAVLSEVDYTNQTSGDLMTFYFRMIDAVGLPVDGGPTVTTSSPGARVINVNPAGRIPGTFQAQVRIGKADSKGLNVFTISAGQVRRDVVVGVQ